MDIAPCAILHCPCRQGCRQGWSEEGGTLPIGCTGVSSIRDVFIPSHLCFAQALKGGIRRSEQRNLVNVGQAVTFPSPCARLPSGRVPYATNAANENCATVMGPNDDGSSDLQSLAFSFDLYGQSFSNLYVNNTGNLSFGDSYSSFSPSGFPFCGRTLVAPFSADVDTSSGASAGYVWA